MCDLTGAQPFFFLVHPGGPFFATKTQGVWTIPKGIPEAGEDLLTAAKREFTEETGITPEPPFYSLGSITQKSGKVVHAWTFNGEWDPASGIVSNKFSMEWPPRSGKWQSFPEADEGRWMSYPTACKAIIAEQIPFLDRSLAVWRHH